MFEEVLDTIENDDLKELAEELIKTIPAYFFEVPASSTGKYHPSYSLGNGGLYRHTLGLCRIMNHIFEVTSYTSREKDLMRIAGMMHDTRKSGTQDAYLNNKYTNFDHPLQAAEVVGQFKGKKWNDDEIEIIQSAIKSHMGRWNTDKRSDVVLPTPQNKYQNLVHLADYLASRKDIEVKFDVTENKTTLTEDSPMPFGKYIGKPIKEVDRDYLRWLSGSECRQELKDIVNKILNS